MYQIIAYAFGLPFQLPFVEMLSHNQRYYMGLSTFPIGSIAFPRINSTFNDPVLIGAFVGMALMMFSSLLCYRYRIKPMSIADKIVSLLVFFLLLFTVILTFSRSSWIGLFLGFFTLGTFVTNNRQTRMFLFKFSIFSMLFFAAILAVYPNIFNIVLGRIGQTFDLSNISTFGHLKWFRAAINAWIENPILGVGLNNFSEFCAKNYQETNMAMTHSAFLTFLADGGVIGFSLEVSFILLILRHLYLAISKAKKMTNTYYYYLLVGLLSAYIVMLGSNITYYFYTQFYVWFFSGLAVSASTYVLKQNT